MGGGLAAAAVLPVVVAVSQESVTAAGGCTSVADTVGARIRTWERA